MTKAERLAEVEYPQYDNKGEWIHNNSLKRKGFIKGYNLRDQTAQSDMVKFAEWIRETYKPHSRNDNYWETRVGLDIRAYSATDLLKIFNEQNG